MPFAWALAALWPLLKKWETWVIITLLVVLFYVLSLQHRLTAAEAALAARPKVETRIDVQTKTVTVQGPERVVEKVVKGDVVERVIYKEPATTTTEAQKDYDRTTAPACPASPAAPWRYAGAVVDPLSTTKLVGVRGGVTIYNRLDLGASWRSQPNAFALEAGVRF